MNKTHHFILIFRFVLYIIYIMMGSKYVEVKIVIFDTREKGFIYLQIIEGIIWHFII